jgi:hypothetical protein
VSASLADESPRRPGLSVRRIALGVLLTAMVMLVAITLTGRGDDDRSSVGFADGPSYLVRSGDTSASVAYLHGVSTDRLLEANDLTLSDSLDPGSRLTVPEPPTEGRRPPRELLADDGKLTYEPDFDLTTERYDLPPGLLEALAWHESEWVNALVSDGERTGLGQLRPEIISFLRREVVDEPLDPHRPEDNITLTGAYLGHLLAGAEGDVAGALAGYYLGFETAAPGTWDLEVVEFVREVLRLTPDFAGSIAPPPTTGDGGTRSTD